LTVLARLKNAHEWKLYQANAIGYFSKRDDGQTPDVRWFAGTVFSCSRCPAVHLRFVPEQAALSAVDVVEIPAAEIALCA